MLSKILKEHIPVDVSKMRSANFTQSQFDAEKEKLQRIEKNHGWKKIDACPLCGNKKFTQELVKYGSPMVACEKCELRFHTAIPADLNDIYKDAEYQIFTTEETPEHFLYKKNRFGKERVRLLETIFGPLTEKKILDIGCGNGYFLAAAKEKSKYCFGSEYSKKNVEKAKANTGLSIYPDPIESFPEKNFDIIVSFDVIEHVEDLPMFVKSIDNLLKKGGHVLFYTPNYDSFSVRLLKEYSSYVDPTEHIILFNAASLKKFGELAGWKIEYMVTRGLDIANILAYQLYADGKQDEFLIEHANELQVMIDHSSCADSLRIIYKKL